MVSTTHGLLNKFFNLLSFSPCSCILIHNVYPSKIVRDHYEYLLLSNGNEIFNNFTQIADHVFFTITTIYGKD